MTIRTATTVALALAVVGASLPAVEEVRRSHANSRVHAEIDRLEMIAADLAAENEVVPGQPARARLTLTLPRGSWGSSGLATLSIPAGTTEHDVQWSLVGGTTRKRHLSVRLVGAGEGLRLDAPGRHRLVLELRQRGGRRAVVVTRPTSAEGVTPA